MKFVVIIGCLIFLSSCSLIQRGHTVKTVKPVYHHTWYKNSRWHKKMQIGRVRIRWFEKQGVKTVKMKG